MIVHDIYRLQRDILLAEEFNAPFYTTFVAMPFCDVPSHIPPYRADEVKRLLCDEVHQRANHLLNATAGQRTFAALHRVDNGQSAVGITDEIVKAITHSHFFVGDLTTNNNGVYTETGIALALKPNERVILFTQDKHGDIHFDLKGTRINRYTEADLVDRTAIALVAAARAFESEVGLYVRYVSGTLTPEAHFALNLYLRVWLQNTGSGQPSIHAGVASQMDPTHFGGDVGRVAFQTAARELVEKRLCWVGYAPNSGPDVDMYGIHATNAGWKVIETIWKHVSGAKKPLNAPTGPELI